MRLKEKEEDMAEGQTVTIDMRTCLHYECFYFFEHKQNGDKYTNDE